MEPAHGARLAERPESVAVQQQYPQVPEASEGTAGDVLDGVVPESDELHRGRSREGPRPHDGHVVSRQFQMLHARQKEEESFGYSTDEVVLQQQRVEVVHASETLGVDRRQSVAAEVQPRHPAEIPEGARFDARHLVEANVQFAQLGDVAEYVVTKCREFVGSQ